MSAAFLLAGLAASFSTPPDPGADVRARDWTTLARTATREGSTAHPRVSLSRVLWVATADERGEPLRFSPLASPLVFEDRALALAERDFDAVLGAFDLEDGRALWTAEIPPPIFDSWSSPTIDAINRTVLVASDFHLGAYALDDGEELWLTPLELDVVNATPVVTTDLGPADRAFITDAQLFGSRSRLYCVNVDPYSGANPYQPGQIVWSVEIGAAYGATPAYRDGRVYVATAAPGGDGPGRILAFDATASAPPAPDWTFTNVRSTGFFGGLTVARGPEGGDFVYAASYAFVGRHFSANVVKVDPRDGSLVWSIESNRSNSIPVVLPGGIVVLSGGIQGFGSDPTLQVFVDRGGSVDQLWDSRLDTWHDDDGDGKIDPGEFLEIGGWPHQPLAVSNGVGQFIYCGAISPAAFEPATDLYELEIARLLISPDEPLTGHYRGAGSTPAVGRGLLLSVGEAGLHAFAPGDPGRAGAGLRAGRRAGPLRRTQRREP